MKAPSLIALSGGDVSGVDIDVSPQQACPTANATSLGVADLSATKVTSTNVGAQIHRSDTKIVILFGSALSGNMQVSIGGQSGDFAISNVHSVTATDGTPGIEFNVVVSPAAALGARSVILQSSTGDVTTFTGGLEVLP